MDTRKEKKKQRRDVHCLRVCGEARGVEDADVKGVSPLHAQLYVHVECALVSRLDSLLLLFSEDAFVSETDAHLFFISERIFNPPPHRSCIPVLHRTAWLPAVLVFYLTSTPYCFHALFTRPYS